MILFGVHGLRVGTCPNQRFSRHKGRPYGTLEIKKLFLNLLRAAVTFLQRRFQTRGVIDGVRHENNDPLDVPVFKHVDFESWRPTPRVQLAVGERSPVKGQVRWVVYREEARGRGDEKSAGIDKGT